MGAHERGESTAGKAQIERRGGQSGWGDGADGSGGGGGGGCIIWILNDLI